MCKSSNNLFPLALFHFSLSMQLFTGLTFLLSQKQQRSCEFSFWLDPYGYVASIYTNPAYLFWVPGHALMQDLGLWFIKKIKIKQEQTACHSIRELFSLLMGSCRLMESILRRRSLNRKRLFSITNVSRVNWTLMYSKSWSNWGILGLKLAFNNLILIYTQCKVVYSSFYNIKNVDYTKLSVSLPFTILIQNFHYWSPHYPKYVWLQETSIFTPYL